MRRGRHQKEMRQSSRRRRGVITLELILTFPILIIVLLAVVEFGLILAASKHVEFASRLGAKLAAESSGTDLETLNTGVISPLRVEIDQYLNTAGYSDSCTVILEHNVAGTGGMVQVNPNPADCPCGPVGSLPSQFPPLPSPAVTTFESVRVTVCLPMEGNIPNCLSTFGFDLDGCTIQQTVVWRYELTPP